MRFFSFLFSPFLIDVLRETCGGGEEDEEGGEWERGDKRLEREGERGVMLVRVG